MITFKEIVFTFFSLRRRILTIVYCFVKNFLEMLVPDPYINNEYRSATLILWHNVPGCHWINSSWLVSANGVVRFGSPHLC
jgi:hypothetical protein